jgi:hypothetical protein
MTTWRERLHSIWAWIKGPRGKRGVYRDLRSMALGLDPASIELPEGERWSDALVAAMEIGLPEATTTIIAIADGTVSMYLSSGGGVIGAGEHAAVRGAADVFRTVVAENRNLLARTGVFAPPEVGEVRFHARIGDDRLTGAAPESALRAGRHALAPLYAAGQDVLTEIRLTTEAAEPEDEGRSVGG